MAASAWQKNKKNDTQIFSPHLEHCLQDDHVHLTVQAAGSCWQRLAQEFAVVPKSKHVKTTAENISRRDEFSCFINFLSRPVCCWVFTLSRHLDS